MGEAGEERRTHRNTHTETSTQPPHGPPHRHTPYHTHRHVRACGRLCAHTWRKSERQQGREGQTDRQMTSETLREKAGGETGRVQIAPASQTEWEPRQRQKDRRAEKQLGWLQEL